MNIQSVPNAITGYPGRPLNGGSNPRFYLFDDDVTRLVKWHPSNQGPKVCFNELVASRIGQLLGAPLLRGGVVYIADRIIPDDHRAIGARSGFHFGVTQMEGDNFIPAQHYAEIENLSQLPAAAVQLALLAVGDQEGHNQFLQRKEATSVGGRKTTRFMLVDMGFMFGGGNWSAPLALPESYPLPPHILEKLTMQKLQAPLHQLEQLEEAAIRQCFADCPADWGITAADIDAAVTTVLARRLKIRQIISTGNPTLKHN